MNLIELSQETNKSISLLKKEIFDNFGIIILSEFNTVQDNIISFFINPESANEDVTTIVDEKQRFEPSIEEERNFLEKLKSIQYPEIIYTEKLLRYCFDNKYLILIDTCSLLYDSFYDFYKIFLSQRHNNSTKMYIPYVVTEELKRIVLEGKKEQKVIDKAINILKFIQAEKDNIMIVGNENDKRTNEHGEKVIHADRVIIEKLIFFRNDSRSSLFITQDYDATVDALKQNDWHSTKSSAYILVKKITNGGALIDNTKETINPKLPIDK